MAGLLGGGLLGAAGLVRVDALREVVLLIPVIALLWLRRQPAAPWLAVGALAGTAYSALAAVLLVRPYLHSIADSLVPLAAMGLVLAGVGAVVVAWRWRAAGAAPSPGPSGFGRALPWLAATAMVGVAALLASRPWWQHARSVKNNPSQAYVASLQRGQHLPGDGTQTYAEHSLTWVMWWVGVATLVLALVTAVVVAYRAGRVVATRGAAVPPWLAPAAVGLGSTVLTLWRPGITPDHPWADRRLVVAVLPTFLLFGLAAVALVLRLVARRAPVPVLVLIALGGLAAVIGPTFAAVAHTLTLRTELGELAAVQKVCASFQPGDVALVVGPRGGNEWPQVLRGVCDVPTMTVQVPGASTVDVEGQRQLAAAVGRIAPEVRAAGGRPVLVGDRSDLLTALGGQPTLLVELHTLEDPRLLTRRPEGAAQLAILLWSAPAPG